MTSLRGKVAVVTGASSGVGKATVQALVAEDVRVTALARGGDGLRALRAEAGPGVETTPLREGSAVIVVSSGAAINGSHLSGGYAGAKRMQWLLAGYAQTHANAKKLGIRFLAVLPIQLIEGTKISVLASSSYAAWQGISPREYMSRFEVPLDVQKVAAAIVGGLRGDVAAGVTAIAVSGKGVEPLG